MHRLQEMLCTHDCSKYTFLGVKGINRLQGIREASTIIILKVLFCCMLTLDLCNAISWYMVKVWDWRFHILWINRHQVPGIISKIFVHGSAACWGGGVVKMLMSKSASPVSRQ